VQHIIRADKLARRSSGPITHMVLLSPQRRASLVELPKTISAGVRSGASLAGTIEQGGGKPFPGGTNSKGRALPANWLAWPTIRV